MEAKGLNRLRDEIHENAVKKESRTHIAFPKVRCHKIFKQIREFFWPLLEKGNNTQCLNISNVDNIQLEEELFKHVLSCYNDEEERRKTIENKSSLFIGTSIVAIVVILITTIFVKETAKTIWDILSIILLFFIAIYLIRTVWFSIKVLERKIYHTLSAGDYILAYSKQNPYKKLISELTKAIQQNQKTNNSKIDNMTMAQEYFKRTIVTIGIFAFILLLNNIL
jgi:hypothetical protein